MQTFRRVLDGDAEIRYIQQRAKVAMFSHLSSSRLAVIGTTVVAVVLAVVGGNWLLCALGALVVTAVFYRRAGYHPAAIGDIPGRPFLHCMTGVSALGVQFSL